jgi:hypothetical protein
MLSQSATQSVVALQSRLVSKNICGGVKGAQQTDLFHDLVCILRSSRGKDVVFVVVTLYGVIKFERSSLNIQLLWSPKERNEIVSWLSRRC